MPRRPVPSSVLLVVASMVVVGCAGGSDVRPPGAAGATASLAAPTAVDGGTVPPAVAAPVVPATDDAAGAAMADFGVALLHQTDGTRNGAISPSSVYTALAMTRGAATGAPAAALDTLLGDDAAAVVMTVDRAAAAAVDAAAGQGSGELEILPANALWVQDGVIRPDFLDRSAAVFEAGTMPVDYRSDPEAARREINGWVGDRTDDRIPELIPGGLISSDTIITLVNALSVSASWAVRVEPSAAPLTFTRIDGTTVVAPSFETTKSVTAAGGDGWRSVTLPYVGHGLAMTLVVPDAGRFDAVRASLTGADLLAAQSGTPTAIRLVVPAFDVRSQLSLRQPLTALGLGGLFRWLPWPALTVDPGLEVKVSDVVHEAVVTTDDRGTAAAAATAVIMESSSGPVSEPEPMLVDRPFLFSIHDTATGAPLFLGQVTDPVG